ncbi:hypothetical protein KAF25_001628 [Fusarium avenaceum]|uniref:Ribonuclease H1 N-terminal domain-containing protein n=1 Tax=Fusarium avenaceum TaxID=40199 RepID=A0A9P7GX69_9HYPO|nr:hypothetical protein KAF25_001628 [Fusarium avenaceum]
MAVSHSPFYAVNVGDERSVVESYDEAKALINGVSRARTKGCWSREEAEITESPSCKSRWIQNKQSSSATELPPASALPTLRTAVATRVTLPMRPAGSVSAASSQSANDNDLREAKKAKKRELAALNDNPLPATEDDPLPAIWNEEAFSTGGDGFVFTSSCSAIEKLLELSVPVSPALTLSSLIGFTPSSSNASRKAVSAFVGQLKDRTTEDGKRVPGNCFEKCLLAVPKFPSIRPSYFAVIGWPKVLTEGPVAFGTSPDYKNPSPPHPLIPSPHIISTLRRITHRHHFHSSATVVVMASNAKEKTYLLNLPLELRLQIFHAYFKVEGGYVYDAESDSLKTADNRPVELSLMSTCRSIANETRHLPLSINTIRFSTLYREEWRRLAGCFNMVKSYFRILLSDFVLHIAHLMTADMLAQLALQYPKFESRLRLNMVQHQDYIAEVDEVEDLYRSGERLGFKPWEIPSESSILDAMRLLQLSDVWKLPNMWHYTPNWHYGDDLAINRLRNTDHYADRRDELHNSYGVRCREKIRFSAVANSIRFLQRRISADQRTHIRSLVLYEDLPSVSTPSCHMLGLAPFFKENPLLRVERHVDWLKCTGADIDNPWNVAAHFQLGWDTKGKLWKGEITLRLAHWLVDAIAITDADIPAEAFTFILESGPHVDYCTDIFQRFVLRDVVWCEAFKALTLSENFDLDSSEWEQVRPILLQDEEVEALGHLMYRTSPILRCDFNTGVAWDFEEVVKDTEGLDSRGWLRVWRERFAEGDLPGRILLHSDLTYESQVADYYEIQTEDDYLRPIRIDGEETLLAGG